MLKREVFLILVAVVLGWRKKEEKRVIHEHEDHGVEEPSLSYLITHH